jgi:transcriptional regulator with XRE-family HTH domain
MTTDLQADTTDLDWRAVGERLRESREYLGLSQADVADALNLSRPAISAIEAGKRKVSGLELKRLARIYRRSYEYFLGEAKPDAADATIDAIFRAARTLSEEDRHQVRRFAEFLRDAGPAPDTQDA